MPKKYIIISLIAIMLLGTFFRLWQLNEVPPALYADEAINGNNGWEAVETGDYKWFYPENNGREGLYINIAGLSLKIFGHESWALRLVSAIFGILTILGLFFLARELFSTRIALFSSFFLASGFWHIIFSRIGFRAIMAPFFLVWAFALLFLASRKKSWILAILGGLSFGLGFHSYIAYRITPLLLIIPFIKLWRGSQKKVIALFLLGAFIAGLPLGWHFLNNPQDFFGRTSQLSVFSSETMLKDLSINTVKTIGMFFIHGDMNWRHNFAGAPQLWWPIAILFLIGLIYAVKRREFFLFLWLIVMSLPVVISNEGMPHALRAIILIPPAMILAALGLEFIGKKVQTKKFVVPVLIFFFIISIYTYTQYFQNWGQNLNTYYAFNGKYWDLGDDLNNLPAQTKKYVIVNIWGGLVNGIPMPAQTIMFKTNDQNIIYITPEQIDSIKCQNGCAVAIMEPDEEISKKILNINPGIKIIP